MSLHLRYISFLWQVADLGCNLNMPLLRDGARVLMKLMPPGIYVYISASALHPTQLFEKNVRPHRRTQETVGSQLVRAVSVSSDYTTVENLRAVCLDHAKLGENSLSPSLDSRFFGPSPSQVLYLIEVGLWHRNLCCCGLLSIFVAIVC